MEREAITYKDLVMTVGDAAVPVISLEIQEGMNQHGLLGLTAVAEQETKEYLLYEGEGSVFLYALLEEEPQCLFSGIVLHMEVSGDGGLFFIHIQAVTNSWLLDFKKFHVSFQDMAMTSHALLLKALEPYPGVELLISIPDGPVGQIMMQYQETGWEFLKRFLSHYGACLYTDSASGRIRLYAGLSGEEMGVEWEGMPYLIYRNLALKGRTGKAQAVYQVNACEILPLGSRVVFQGQELFVGGIVRTLEDGLLVNQYSLYFEEGLEIKKYHNPLLAGVSVFGTVTGVQRDRVRVRMVTDASGTCQDAFYFPYSTVAASPDGSGWYCMPKAGDSVRIFFPERDEKEGYAVSSILGQVSQSGGNPDRKNITTPDQKTVQFIDGGILLAVRDGKGSVKLMNNGMAEIHSDTGIRLGAASTGAIQAGGKVTLKAGTKVRLQGLQDSISMEEGKIVMDGWRILSNS